ncbi:MAG TPA: histidinol-phosphate transaminase [Gemmatimonadaceae bacterium]|jgi:histidinol-phosphate aminotransferase|nr:histidinol-phosphate transaminase [Gemmatimonadaceae bacterium]
MSMTSLRPTSPEGTTAPTTLDIARAAYRSIAAYAPNTAPAAIDLSDNTNLWGAPPNALRQIRAAEVSTITRYPALNVADLKSAIAAYLNVTPEMVVTGCGSDDVLDCTMRAFGNPSDVLVHPEPSFGMIPLFARVNGLRPIGIPLTETLDVNVGEMLAARAKITYLCSPNNPTGNALPRATIEQIVDEAPGLVIIDEAYAEFARTNCVDLLRRSPRILITRTMSKAFGLAGLRVGYGIADPAVVTEIEKARGPYKVNAIAAQAATTALREDRAWVNERVQEAISNRDRLITELATLGLSPIPSAANFVCVPVSGAAWIDRTMRERGVAVRAFEGLPCVGDALRIAVGPWPMLEECLGILREILA